jgi:hypothetical protein
MINSSASWRIKPFAFAALMAALLFFFAIASINIYVNRFRRPLETWLSRGIESNVMIGHIGYVFPHYIVVDKVRIFKRYGQTQKVALFARKIVLPLNLLKSIVLKKPVVEKMYIDGADIFYSEATALFGENGKKIMRFIALLPRPDAFKVESAAVLILPPKNDEAVKVHLFNTFEIDRAKLFDFGEVKIERIFLLNKGRPVIREVMPLAYNCELFSTKDGFEVEKLEIKRHNIYSKLWGNYRGGTLQLNGFLYTGHFFAEAPGLRYRQKIFDQNLGFTRKDLSAKVIGSSPLDLNIFDIACTAKIAYPKIEIKPLSFSLGNVPLSINGEFILGDPVQADLLLQSFPDKHDGRDSDRRFFDVSAQGVLRQGIYNGKCIFDYAGKSGQSVVPGRVVLDFKNLEFHYAHDDSLKMSAEKINFSQTAKTYKRDLEFSNFNARFGLKDEKTKTFSLDSRLYDGLASADGHLDLSGSQAVWDLDTVVRAVTAAKLASLVKQFGDIEGRLNSRFHWHWDQSSMLKGRIAVKGGKLNDYDFFVWLAGTFGLEELRRVNFDFLSLGFFIDDTALKLDNINLKSKRIAARGYYGVNRGMVASKIALAIPRDELAKSEKFKPLVKLVGRNMPLFDFDFQLSGPAEAMNFKWLDSEFKDKLKKAIPGFVERGIERQVEMILDKNILGPKTGGDN